MQKKTLVKTAYSRKMTTLRKVEKWPLLKSFNLHFSITLILTFIIKFPYNTRSDWLKQRALSGKQSTG